MTGESTDAELGTVGPYRLIRALGQGGSGTVFEAEDSRGARVAVKVLHRELADSPEVRARLKSEAATLQRVRGERTAQFLAIEADGEAPYLVMEFVAGKNLQESVQDKVLTGPLLGALAEGLIEALTDIHSAGVIHRDLKPQNVIFGPDGVMIVDFGTSVLTESVGSTRTGALVGTPAWIAPEQALGDAVGPPADVFNLGMLLAFAASGRHPFGQGRPDAMLFRIVHQEPDLEAIPTALRPLVAACLNKDPESRPTLTEASRMLRLNPSRSGDAVAASSQTRFASETRIDAIVKPVGAVTTSESQSIRLTRRTVLLSALVAVVLALASSAAVFLSRASTSGPIAYSVRQLQTNTNPWISPATVEIRVAESRQTIDVDKDASSSPETIDGISWTLDEPLLIEYQPGFLNDESHTVSIDLRDVGVRFAARDWRTLIEIEIYDSGVRLRVLAPVTSSLLRVEREVVHTVSLERGNETEFLAISARELAEARQEARAQQAACAQDGQRELQFFLDPVLGHPERYDAALDRLWRLGRFYDSAYWDDWARRARNVSNWIDSEVQDIDRFIRLRPPVPSDAYQTLLGLPQALRDLSAAWRSMATAMDRESTSGYRDAEVLIAGSESERRTVIRQVENQTMREIRDACAAAYPVP